MTIEEAKHALEELKRQGNDEETILKILYMMYQDGKMAVDDLRIFTELLGYEFTSEFEAMSDEDKRTKGLKRESDKESKQSTSKKPSKRKKRSQEVGMTLEEAKHALDELKSQGESDEDILKTLYLMYTHDKMTLEDLRIFTELLGYEFTDEFEAMSEEDKKTKGLTDVDEADNKSKRTRKPTRRNKK